jgi:CPA2 family monovalent cation:H+ antiporter-2
MILSVSSTAIVLQTLSEKGLMRSGGGRSAFAVLLMQDIAVVPILAVIPLLALAPDLVAGAHGAADAAHGPGVARLIDGLPAWAAGLATLAMVAGIVAAGHFLSGSVFRYVHASHLPEMGTFIALVMVTGIAVLMSLVGLSPALGTFVAGVVLANSEFRHQIESDIKPFKGLLMGLFFMTVGVGIETQLLAQSPLTIAVATLGLLVIKAAVLFALALVFRMHRRDRWLFALSLAQGGEFGFLLVSMASSEGILPAALSQTTMMVISLSMLLTPALFLLAEAAARHLSPPEAAPPDADTIEDKGRVIVTGIGRFGQVVNRLVRTAGAETVVLDSDMATIETLRRFGMKGFFGDPTRPDLLEAAGLRTADVLVVAVDSKEAALTIVRHARHLRPDIRIVARAYDRVHVYELYQAGADDIVRELFDSSIRAGRYVLESIGFSEYEASLMARTYFRVDRAAVKDLAQLWVPGQPVERNQAYIERARQLDRDLETAIITDMDEARPRTEAAE